MENLMNRVLKIIALGMMTCLMMACSQSDDNAVSQNSADVDVQIEGPAFVLFFTEN